MINLDIFRDIIETCQNQIILNVIGMTYKNKLVAITDDFYNFHTASDETTFPVNCFHILAIKLKTCINGPFKIQLVQLNK